MSDTKRSIAPRASAMRRPNMLSLASTSTVVQPTSITALGVVNYDGLICPPFNILLGAAGREWPTVGIRHRGIDRRQLDRRSETRPPIERRHRRLQQR